MTVKENSLLPTWTLSQRLNKLYLTMKFLACEQIYVDIMFAKFEGPKIYTKKDTQNLPTYVVMRNNFTTTIFAILSRAEKLFIYHEFFFVQ